MHTKVMKKWAIIIRIFK